MAACSPLIHFGLESNGLFVFRVLSLVSFFLFGYLIRRRLALLRSGRKDPRLGDIRKRMDRLVRDGILQMRQWRYRWSAVIHLFIFWGFCILLWRSAQLLWLGFWPDRFDLQSLLTSPYNYLKDFTETAVLAAALGALWRRAVVKPARYKDSRQFEAYAVLALIGVLMISDMSFDGTFLAAGIPLTGWHIGSLVLSKLFAGVDSSTLNLIRSASYWIHMICFFLFLNLLPLSKHFHILTALPNIFLKKLNRGEIKPPRWESPRIGSLTEAGAGRIEEMTWKHLLDLCACTECGRCSEHCPAKAAGRNLSPKQVIMALRDHAYRQAPLRPPMRHRSNRPAVHASICGPVVGADTVWACTTCGACETQCPVFIEHVDKLIEMRRHLVLMKADFPPELGQLFRNLEIYGDPWGMGGAQRDDWAEGLRITRASSANPQETLLWVGCAGAFDDRYRRVMQATARVLLASGIEFGILDSKSGGGERCCGDFARRTGNEYLFQKLAVQNIETLRLAGVRRIITACPHGYNTFKNEYPRFGGRFEVVHHSQAILELLQQGRLCLSSAPRQRIAYHDPCYLARYNGIMESPRILIQQIAGGALLEPSLKREQSFCCGGGGGYLWLSENGRRVNEIRAGQLLELGAEIVATACPFCLSMLQDGLDARAAAGTMPKVLDLAELVQEALK